MYGVPEGRVLVHGDYSQLELRVMAAVAQDPVLERFLASGDVYTQDAIAFFGLPVTLAKCDCKGGCKAPDKHVKPAARKQSKIIHLASNYRATKPTVFKQALKQMPEIKYSTVVTLHDKFLRTYARTVEWWDEEHERVLRAGYSESRVLHTRRVYPEKPEVTETANYPIQATAADVANLAMIALDDALFELFGPPCGEIPEMYGNDDAGIVTQVHDAFDVDCREEHKQAVIDVMRRCMETPVSVEGRDWVFPVEIKTGRLWSDV